MLVASDWSLIIAVTIAFALVAHPQTYKVVQKLASKVPYGPTIVTQNGVPTSTGLLAHALVAAFVVHCILRFI